VRLAALGSFLASGSESELTALENLLNKVNVLVAPGKVPSTLTQAFALQGAGTGLPESLKTFLPSAKVSLQGSNLIVEGSSSEVLRAANLIAALDKALPKPPEAAGKVTRTVALSNGKADVVATQIKALGGEGVTVVSDLRTNTLLISGAASAIEALIPSISELDKPVAQAALRVQITQIDVTTAKSLGLDWKTLTGGLGLSTLRTLASGDLSALDLTLNVLAQSGRSKTLTDARFLVTTNQITKLVSGGTVLLPKTTSGSTSSGGNSSSSSVSGYESQNFGLDIELAPQIGADGTINLGVKTSLGRAPIAGAGGSLQFPAQSFSSQIRFRSGETVVFGGVVGSTVTENRSGIPVLKDLPIIGGLFGTSTQSRSSQALLIVIRGDSNLEAVNANKDFEKKIAP